MGYIKTGTANARTAPTLSRQIETDAATLAIVRLIVREIRLLEFNAANLRESECGGIAEIETAASNRRFVGRVVEAASDGVREQLRKEGTWQ
jgi:hypothetical protein